MTVEMMRRFRVFCPRCKDDFEQIDIPTVIRRVIDRACRNCGKTGVDAVEL